MNRQKIEEKIIEQFGSNFQYVLDLYDEFLKNPSSIDESWAHYFSNFIVNEKNTRYEEKTERIAKEKLSQSLYEISLESLKKKNIDFHQASQLGEVIPIVGTSAKLIENMENSLSIPTATTTRAISAKLLEEHRRIINSKLSLIGGGKISFTHIIAYAIVKALKKYPSLNNSFAYIENKPHLIKKEEVNFGLAIDIVKKGGSRFLLVPNIKKANELNFKEFVKQYDDLVERARTGRVIPEDFLNTTISITNPGMLGTLASYPRLMINQGCIIAIGAIDYPAEFKAMNERSLAMLGVGKVFYLTNTYDHRIIQGAESGEFLREIEDYLLGKYTFYEELFADLGIPQKPLRWQVDADEILTSIIPSPSLMIKQARLMQLINMYRVRGHLIANTNPLFYHKQYFQDLDPEYYGLTIWDYDRTFYSVNLGGIEKATLREILDILTQTYCDKIGVEYMHIQNPEERSWLQQQMEPNRNKLNFSVDEKKRILWKLASAEIFEKYLHTNFIGHKRFSLEGCETVIVALDYLLNLSGEKDVEEVCIGMAHRGRLNVLANIIGKPYNDIFAEFEENFDPYSFEGSGDVKYHLGASGYFDTSNGKKIKVSVAYNPSHLEFVDPVLLGIVRAKQKIYGDINRSKIIPILIHGDAAFAGQGIVMETLNLSQLEGYSVGGTIHIIINNQIGFTTNPQDARSSHYATDAAKAIQVPIFHINGEDPEAVLTAVRLAFEYRNKFNKDVVIDIIGYRKHGHNEGDEPSITQPIMYKIIKSKPSIKEIYSNKLISENVITIEEKIKIENQIIECNDLSYRKLRESNSTFTQDKVYPYSEEEIIKAKSFSLKTEINELYDILEKITQIPQDFQIHPKLKKFIDKRRSLIGNPDLKEVDWSTAEALAFGWLLTKGISIRLSGQDSSRGTFNQRHSIWFDYETQKEYEIFSQFQKDKVKAEIIDSLLSEAAVLGYEFGYSLADPLTLTIWEAQFGDFANVAQVLIDNFIASSFAKWNIASGLTMFLPHGYEGQGPEHSSARIERFLTLCAENNMRICNLTEPVQFFSLLKLQAAQIEPKPLVIFTPKSLLRHPMAKSSLRDLVSRQFIEILDDQSTTDKSQIKTLLITSGKIYYELLEERSKLNIKDVAIIRLEQYYPFNFDLMNEILKSYKNLRGVKWVQEEPKNMGAWTYLISRVWSNLDTKLTLEYVGRQESSSPAPGKTKMHEITQREIIEKSFQD